MREWELHGVLLLLLLLLQLPHAVQECEQVPLCHQLPHAFHDGLLHKLLHALLQLLPFRYSDQHAHKECHGLHFHHQLSQC